MYLHMNLSLVKWKESRILGRNEWKNRQYTLEDYSGMRYPDNWWPDNRGRTVLSLSVTDLEYAHDVDDALLDGVRADDGEGGQEVLCHSDEGVLRPTAEPVHRAAREQTRELQGAVAELLADLDHEKSMVLIMQNAMHNNYKFENYVIYL